MVSVNFNPSEVYDINVKSRLVIRDKKKSSFVLRKVIDPGHTYDLNIEDYKPYWNFQYKFQVKGPDKKTGEERWVDATTYKILYPERMNKDGLKYLLFEKKVSKILVVVFQAINKEPTYNYVGTLSNYNVNQLFIKDDYGGDKETKSSYYIGRNKNTNISEATQDLIKNTVNNLKIEKTIFIGSSKGGFSALYHGLLFGATHIIAGGPTVLLGQHLTRHNDMNTNSSKIFQALVGERTEDNIKWADNLMVNAIKNAQSPYPNIHIHVGFWDSFYQNHVVNFMNLSNEKNITSIDLNIKPYSKHSDLAKYFPNYIQKTIDDIL